MQPRENIEYHIYNQNKEEKQKSNDEFDVNSTEGIKRYLNQGIPGLKRLITKRKNSKQKMDEFVIERSLKLDKDSNLYSIIEMAGVGIRNTDIVEKFDSFEFINKVILKDLKYKKVMIPNEGAICKSCGQILKVKDLGNIYYDGKNYYHQNCKSDEVYKKERFAKIKYCIYKTI